VTKGIMRVRGERQVQILDAQYLVIQHIGIEDVQASTLWRLPIVTLCAAFETARAPIELSANR
jgi:hypothetical protein